VTQRYMCTATIKGPDGKRTVKLELPEEECTTLEIERMALKAAGLHYANGYRMINYGCAYEDA
jgi:hypothetical protein